MDSTVRYVYSDKADKERVLVTRSFCVTDDGTVYFSSPTEDDNTFLGKHDDIELCGIAKLYPRGSQQKSFVDFNLPNASDNRQAFVDNKENIISVLSELKSEFGFRYTTRMKFNGTEVQDVEMQGPMNIGHVLRNPHPETEVAENKVSIKKEAQQQQQNTSVFPAFRLLSDGHIELALREYARPITMPQRTGNAERKDIHSGKEQYVARAITQDDREIVVSFMARPEEIGPIVPNINTWAADWETRKPQQQPQEQPQQQQGQLQGSQQVAPYPVSY